MTSGIQVTSDLYGLMLQLDQLTECENSSQMFNVLSDLPSTIDDVDELISASKEVAQSLKHGLIESHRRKHLAYLMADHGAILNPEQTNNLPKQVSPQPRANLSTYTHLEYFVLFWGYVIGKSAVRYIENTQSPQAIIIFNNSMVNVHLVNWICFSQENHALL